MIKDQNIPTVSVSEGPVPGIDIKNARVEVPEHPWDYKPKKKFKDTAFGRTLRGKNAAGKVLYLSGAGVLAKFTGIDLTPIINGATQMEAFIDLGAVELIIMAVVAILGFVTSRGLVSGLLQEIFEEVRDVVVAVQKAREATSPGGKEVSPEEQRLILKEVDDLVMVLYKRLLRSRMARLFGLKPNKNPEN